MGLLYFANCVKVLQSAHFNLTLSQKYSESPHKNTEPVTDGADLKVSVWFLRQTYAVASAPGETDSVFMWRLRLLLGQCRI